VSGALCEWGRHRCCTWRLQRHATTPPPCCTLTSRLAVWCSISLSACRHGAAELLPIPAYGNALSHSVPVDASTCALQAGELDEALLFGVPHMLLPEENACGDMEAADSNKQLLAAICQA